MASLLLRLFHSDYFSPHLALSYLKTYSDNIGITYYLVYRLRTSFAPEEVEFYWPQLCHLLITKPSESRALECFILERCEESVHVALLTLWYLQAALFDLGNNPHTASFGVCKRVYNECQRILYDDPLSDANLSFVPAASHSSTSGSQLQRLVFSSARTKEKISQCNIKSACVGVGTVLASVPGMPLLAGFSGQVAIEQGRAKPNTTNLKSDDEWASGMERIPTCDASEDDDTFSPAEDTDSEEDDTTGETYTSIRRTADAATSSAPTKQAGKQTSLAFKGAILANNRTEAPPGKASSASENPFANLSAGINELRGKATAAIGDAFGQTFRVTFPPADSEKTKIPPAWHPQNSGKRRPAGILVHAAAVHAASGSTKSVPNLNGSRTSLSRSASTAALTDGSQSGSVDAVLQQYDAEARRRLLRSHYCRTQTQFLLTLQDVSARLLLLPKPARLSALRAELTALNHKLPAEVCFPLWCAASSEIGAGVDSENAIENAHLVPGTEEGCKERGNGPPISAHRGRIKCRGILKHHRVVRINPSEAVVLNSADRAPYLLHVEVLQDDLDFDPERRSNRESLKKLVVAEDLRRRKFALSRAFGTDSEVSSREGLASMTRESSRNEHAAEADALSATDSNRVGSTSVASKANPATGVEAAATIVHPVEVRATSSGPSRTASAGIRTSQAWTLSRPSSPNPDDCEEVDLTEQAFGADLAAFGGQPEPETDEEDDFTTINRHHDAAAWINAREAKNSLSTGGGTNSHGRQGSISATAAQRKDFSLDEYSERMRTAAIMLAQLNQSTNAGSQPAVTHNPHVSATAKGGWSSWIIGTSWAAGHSATPSLKSETGQESAGMRTSVNVPNSASSSQPNIGGMNTGLGVASSSGPPKECLKTTVGGGGNTSSRLIHTDTEMIRKRIMQEMMALEEERMERMKAGPRRLGPSGHRPTTTVEDEATVLRAVNKDDPSAAIFRETWAVKKARIRASSPYGHLPTWDVFSVIVKTGADLRQEQLAVQLIKEFGRIWQECNSKIWVRYFRILVTSESSGLMETVTDAVSVHSIKKEAYARTQRENEGGKITTYSIYDHFVDTYGDPASAKFNRARDRFIESLAGYSIISYLLQIKDRHNGNILLASDGRIIHIDFGFMLGISPGSVGFEAAPFKLTQEYIDILGGLDSLKFDEFKKLMRQGFKDVRKEAERIIMIVELMQKNSKLPCFALGELTASNLRDRFALALSAQQVDDFVDRLILASCASSYTRLYDTFQ